MGVWRIGTSAELRGWSKTRRRAKTGVGSVRAQLLHAHLNGWVRVIVRHTHRHYRRISERSVRKAGVPLGPLAWIPGIIS